MASEFRHPVYVATEARDQGVGRLALATLLEEAERRGFWKLVSRTVDGWTA
ncbi:MAG: GNAT family N-acetyltransferase [Candidatus Dormibacter sp.]